MAVFTAPIFLFSPGKKTVAVKTAMKRLGNRSDKIKKTSARRVLLESLLNLVNISHRSKIKKGCIDLT